jgi:hypothetical protein
MVLLLGIVSPVNALVPDSASLTLLPGLESDVYQHENCQFKVTPQEEAFLMQQIAPEAVKVDGECVF